LTPSSRRPEQRRDSRALVQRRHPASCAHIDEERDQLPGPAPQRLACATSPGRGEQLGVMQPEHAGARPDGGRCSHAGKGGDHLAAMALGRRGRPNCSRLATAKVWRRHLDVQPPLPTARPRQTRRSPKQIDQTGHQQRDARRLGSRRCFLIDMARRSRVRRWRINVGGDDDNPTARPGKRRR